MTDGFPAGAFQRLDETPDADFYAAPRMVTHIDEGAIAAVTELYREYFPANGAILDLMSSWVSHLPPEASYRRITGLGMNADELAANPRLARRFVQNLNRDPALPLPDASVDAVRTTTATLASDASCRIRNVSLPAVISGSPTAIAAILDAADR